MQLRWFALQFVVALGVFVLIGETVGVEGRGLAPAIVSMAVAWGATTLVSKLVDLSRRIRVRKEAKRGSLSGVAANRHSGNGPQLPRRTRICQDRREII